MDKQKQAPRYVTAVGLDDVQLGRGRPVVTSEGNQRFRALILQHKPEYSSSNRHAHKDIVARKILAIISDRGGKFLRKIESSVERKKLAVEDGVDAWEVADEETSINKVKQALRENESSLSGTDDAPGTTSTIRKPKKGALATDSLPTVEVGKRGADSDSGKSTIGSLKSINPKKKRKRQVEAPISLADSIRANASKLGSDFSFADSSDSHLKSNINVSIPQMKSQHVGGSTQESISKAHFDQSTNLQLLEHHLASATNIAGDYPVSLKTQSVVAKADDLQSVSQSDKESFVHRTIASALAVSDDRNNPISGGYASIDSRREDVHNVHGNADSTTTSPGKGSSSDEDKKPAAL